ncbi:MAG: bifunctional demethylmenaquinone methyltransferase/2-methoxy-6-polyprenyl-1,4-benzoquinol methylase UbiE [Chitinophagaceae bacterium]|nr:bifunctional demethylmenaquinone methyltransferase/2-methoxy-6-polyprenyl-1,4-benzoquinol methylase UbiE [Chitinophagaceae bacterium]
MSLPHDSITPLSDSDKAKKVQVAEMFDRIAGRYDFMNRFLSARIDKAWRKKALLKLKKNKPKQILDVATGTADLALMAHDLLQPEQIKGIDISTGMLQLGREKIKTRQLADKISLETGDAETINSPSDSFDAVMVAFGVRNFENLHAGLTEMLRVLKSGGQLMVLEFSTPRNWFIKFIYNLYMQQIAPFFARLFNTDHQAYAYLNKSTNAFPDRTTFCNLLKEAGYTEVRYESLTFGICCIYTAQKK